jgi:hypothetical protein
MGKLTYAAKSGIIQKVNGALQGGQFDLLKVFKFFLKKLSVPFHDACCDTTPLMIAGVFPQGAQDNIAAAAGGAISVENYLTTINTDAGGDAFTLADGTKIGQMKKILLVVDGGGNGVVTPANLSGGTTLTFNDAGDFVILQFNGIDWVVVENSGVTLA